MHLDTLVFTIDYIMEKNLEAFITYVPDIVFTAFKPKIPYYLLKKALLNPKINKTFTERILFQSFPPDTIHRISISSISDLKVYTTTFIQTILIHGPGTNLCGC